MYHPCMLRGLHVDNPWIAHGSSVDTALMDYPRVIHGKSGAGARATLSCYPPGKLGRVNLAAAVRIDRGEKALEVRIRHGLGCDSQLTRERC